MLFTAIGTTSPLHARKTAVQTVWPPDVLEKTTHLLLTVHVNNLRDKRKKGCRSPFLHEWVGWGFAIREVVSNWPRNTNPAPCGVPTYCAQAATSTIQKRNPESAPCICLSSERWGKRVVQRRRQKKKRKKTSCAQHLAAINRNNSTTISFQITRTHPQ